jgi:hypothetical protein
MVGATIVLSILLLAAVYVAWSYRRDYLTAYGEGLANAALAEKHFAAYEAEQKISSEWKLRYDTLVEKLRTQAAKSDDGIIHVRNSGDVRRVFEQQVAQQMAAAEKAQEN